MAAERFPISLNVEGQKATLAAEEPHMETHLAEEFEAACERLLDTGQRELVVDFSKVQTIQSCLIGEVAKTKVIASEDKRKFLLVANARIAEIFKMILSDLVDVEVKQ
jgi:anti-anti-sigma regulatory factor